MSLKCEICKYILQDKYAYQNHLRDKTHLKNAERLEFPGFRNQRSIFVSNYPRYMFPEKLLDFFSQFDQIVSYRRGHNYLIIEFRRIQTVNYLLTESIYFNGIKLNIIPKINNIEVLTLNDKINATKEAVNDTEYLNYKNIKSLFNVQSTFDEQLSAFLDKISLPISEIKTRYEPICEALDKIFHTVFPNCKTHRFGSTVSNLGFKNCDLDLFLEIVNEEIGENVGSNVSATKIFSKVKKILFTNPTIFHKVSPIPKARIPIIKFIYIPKNISCDISFKNSLAIYNSRLIKFYFSMNPYLRPTMMILKYWVRYCELKKYNTFSNYALTLLFIFYLQQSSANLIPPVIELKKKCVPIVVEGWQVNFDETYTNKQNNNTKHISIPELLNGFFKFYAHFNFEKNVVCCIDGLSHEKLLLSEPENLPECMDRYKIYLKTKNSIKLAVTKPMCVQDPNELNHNITGNMTVQYIHIFQKYCLTASEICENANNNYSKLLPSMFSLILNVMKKNIGFYVCISFDLLDVKNHRDIKFHFNMVEQAFKKENCLSIIFNLIRIYFENVLKLEVQITSENDEINQQETNKQSDDHSKSKITMHCTGKYALWRNRKNNIFYPSMTLLEKEIIITNNIFENLYSKDSPPRVDINFECHVIKKKTNSIYVHLVLTKNDCTKPILIGMINYINNKLPFILYKTLHYIQESIK
ncbi:PREDICTED: speckle targeted PIP5K1A-regulated poly(A) polymerase-like [Ceratosolen solmsi marchali]|uniref:Speckle targeted PIP5K1A-regulated poly(A) polymerase-like n=1 Tax=Ceratosolen solmsi marchali TaxID=326594 RepID=A0AAJ7E2V5_9HYME|nr:PREDICTED: speckle targeted PIP5K1A-regulated poly(A) polymerase-like [Ceratosolen solmsi marchali]